MTRSTVHLIGGGPGTFAAFRRHLGDALPTPRGGKPPLVAYVGAASGDDEGFFKMIGGEVTRVGARAELVKLANPRARRSAAQAILEDCDLVLMSGGDVDEGMNVLHHRDALPLFHALGREGRPMVGLSAGSIMLGRAWVRFPDHGAKNKRKPAPPPAVIACMDLAPIYVDAHAEEDGWEELRVLLGLLDAVGVAHPIGFGLTKRGAVRVEPMGSAGAGVGASARVKVVALGTAAPRFVLQGDRVVKGASLKRGSVVEMPTGAPRRGTTLR